jgi:hypothetical protein
LCALKEIVLSSRGLVPPGWIEEKLSSATGITCKFDIDSNPPPAHIISSEVFQYSSYKEIYGNNLEKCLP